MNFLQDRTAVLLDRHPLWLDAVEQILQRMGVRIMAKASSSAAALTFVQEFEPDLLVADLSAASDSGESAALLRRARELAPDIRVIALSTSDDVERVSAALQAGAAAYVVKTAHRDDFAAAVRQSFSTSIYLASSLAASEASQPAATDGHFQDLTPRELEILRLVAEGYSNAQLAHMLWVSEQTVKFHLSNVYRKLGVANRTEASRWGQRHGLLSADLPEALAAG